MRKSLSKSEIDHLFTFVRSKYVRYTDVQFEIVDHLASGIEEVLEGDASLTFQQALDKVYSRFPITGFTEWVAKRETGMTRYWYKRFFQYTLSYLKLPKVILSGLLVTLFLYLLSYAAYGLILTIVFSIGFSIYAVIQSNRKLKLLYKERGEMLLVQAYRGLTGSLAIALFAGIIPTDLHRLINPDFSAIQFLLFAIFFAFINIWSYGIAFVFPEMLMNEVQKKYGHLQMR